MDSKLTSILSYISFLWPLPFFAGKKDDSSVYHLRQGFGLMVLMIVYFIVFKIIALISGTIASIFSYFGFVILAFMVIGIINVLNGEKKPLPFIGKSFEGFDFIK
nr:hypothetical protein [uncultured Capnocytophaga sp.]